MRRNLRIIFFWGTAWGALEATLSYIFQSNALNIGGFLWFPIGFFFMNKVYKQTGGGRLSRWAILGASFIAATIKLSDLLLPNRIDTAINSAVANIFEGFAVYFAFMILERQERLHKLNYYGTLFLSISWRIIYALYLLLFPLYHTGLGPISRVPSLFRFIFLEGVANSIIIYFYISIFDKKYDEVNTNSIIFEPFVSVALLVTAVFFQIGC